MSTSSLCDCGAPFFREIAMLNHITFLGHWVASACSVWLGYIYIHTHIDIHIQTDSPFNQTKRRGGGGKGVQYTYNIISVRRCEVLALFGQVVPTGRTKRVIRLSEPALVVLSNWGFISGCGFMYITGEGEGGQSVCCVSRWQMCSEIRLILGY